MAWFTPSKYELSIAGGEIEEKPINPPLKRVIKLDDISQSVTAGTQLYINLDNLNINRYLSSSLVLTEDDFSYIVVLEDDIDEEFFVPVKSRIVDNVLYFIAEEDIEKGVNTDRYYALYYGSTYIKTVELVDDVYVSQVYGDPVEEIGEGLYFDLAESNIDFYSYEASGDDVGQYSLAFYNSGVDWKDNVSQKEGAKAFGIFDGPRLQIIGPKNELYGKFRIRILQYTNNENISSIPAVDWTEVDCFSYEALQNQVLYQITNLEYRKYIFEIETLSTKNTMAKTKDVKIDLYKFTPNYNLTYGAESLNPNITFVKVAGVR